MIASCEIEQPQLQQLLYDLEAGMPFLFVDQLVVQTPLTASGSGRGSCEFCLRCPGNGEVRNDAKIRDRPHIAGVVGPCGASRHDHRVPMMRWTPTSRRRRGPRGCRGDRPFRRAAVTTVRVVAPPQPRRRGR